MVDCLGWTGPSLACRNIHLAREICIWQPAGGPAVLLPDDVRTVLQELNCTYDLTPSIVPEILQPCCSHLCGEAQMKQVNSLTLTAQGLITSSLRGPPDDQVRT